MITTLGESQANLPELVELASHGEEIFITVQGTVKAKLSGIESTESKSPGAIWADELRELHRSIKALPSNSSAQILDELREDRI